MDMKEFLLIVFSVVMFVLQLWLCLTIKRVILRLLPTVLTGVPAIVFFVMIFFASGWDALGFLLLFIITCVPLGGCLLAWIVFGVISLIKRIRKQKQPHEEIHT